MLDTEKQPEVVQEPVAPEQPEGGQPTVPSEPAAPEAVEASAPAYVPNYKFKAYEKEYEFPEHVKSFIKDKELEEKFRADYAKAFAHDELREKYTTVKPYREKYEAIEQNISKLEKHLNNGDVENFFVGLGYQPQQVEQMLSKYVLDKLNEREMPEDQRRALNESRAAKQRAQEYEEKYGSAQTKLQELETRQLETELRITLNDPTIADLAKQWDDRLGKPGSFREEVIIRADQASRQLGRVLTPQEAVNDFAQYAQKIIGTAGPMQGQQPGYVARPKPTIPNPSNKNATSPAGRKFKSLEDIEKHNQDRGWA